MAKKKVFPGADENSPSRSEYFSWINSTNEGSDESQTLANLAYFAWLKEKYGMQLDIYAWDAGNLDGASGTYEYQGSEKLIKQYPNGYGPIADAAAKSGTRLGVWCGPDGYGETEEEEAKRRETLVSLCRDFHFELFKMDGVCGTLSSKKQKAFIKTMQECRKYSPDLILLNHRLDFGKGMPYATTFLWEGVETYSDVHICNDVTAPHNRAYMFARGNLPRLRRLTEDHGVCLSSCMDYFTDELIYQAFGRCLILAPEIYGNPWLLKDTEHAKLAYIFNLHKRYSDILVNGKTLPASYGCNAVSRGTGSHRFIATGSDSWNGKDIRIRLGRQTGLAECGKVTAVLRHPEEKILGTFAYGDTVRYRIEPFRAALIELIADGEPEGFCGYDDSVSAPVFLGSAVSCDIPADAGYIYESARFATDSDSLEQRCLDRAGKTKYAAVRSAREKFFGQETYAKRGLDYRAMFDGNDETYFDAQSKKAYGGFRIDGGCLRVDFGEAYDCDAVRIEYFIADEDHAEVDRQTMPAAAYFSEDLHSFEKTRKSKMTVLNACEKAPVVTDRVHNIRFIGGRRVRTDFPVNGKVRYFRLPCPVDRIYKISVIKDGKEIIPANAFANNLLPDSAAKPVKDAAEFLYRVPAKGYKNKYIAVACDGKTGNEGAVCAAVCSGKAYNFPERAPSYPSNTWECPVRRVNGNYTFFLPLTKELAGKEIRIVILKTNKNKYPVNVYLCEYKD